MTPHSLIPKGRSFLALFTAGLLLVATATVLFMMELFPSLLERLVPEGSLEVDSRVSGAIFIVGFAMVAIAQTLGTDRKTSKPKPKPKSKSAPPVGALLPDAPEDVELVRQAVADKLSPKKTTLAHALSLFTISLILFALQLQFHGGFRTMWLVALLVVLLVHELGHLLTMWAFGYSELRMFFIPMFGAAVSGRKHDATAGERAIVSLMGPAPGLVFALVAVFFEPFESRFLHDLVQLALIINAFNLLPFVPLDGGNLLDVTLFARWPRSRQIMGQLSGLGIAAIGWFLDTWILVGLGALTILTAGTQRLFTAVARDFREKLDANQTDSFAPPPEAIPIAIDSVNRHVFAATPLKPTPKRYANVVAGAWPRVRSLAPSRRKAALLLCAYATCLLVAVMTLIASSLIRSDRGSYTWHANGQPSAFGKPGIYGHEGEWRYWHPNGALKASGSFVDGVKEGPWRYLHPDEELKSEGAYEGGQKIGLWHFQSEDGEETTRDFGQLPPGTELIYDETRTQIRCHFDNPEAAESALNCAESAFRVAARFLPQADNEVERGEFHLFRNREDYRLAEWRKTKGRYKDNIAFTLYDEPLTYLYVSPKTSDAALTENGLPTATLERIARAATLNTLVWRMPAFRELPAWLEFGFRAYVAHRATTPRNAPVRTATWFPLAKMLAAEERLPSATEITTTNLKVFKKDERYALRAALFELLAQDNELPQLFAELARQEKGDTTGVRSTLDAWLTEARVKSLDAQLRAFLEE